MRWQVAQRFLGASVLSAGCLTAIPALAQTSREWDRCAGKDSATLDQRINGCTSVIHSTGETPKNLALAFMGRGSAYMIKGDFDRAIQDYNQAIRLDPNNALAFNNRGFAYGSKGDFDRAIRDYDQAIRLSPNAPLAFYNRGEAHAKKGDFDGAIQDYDRAIELNPDFARALLNRGFVYAAKGEFDRAIQDYDQAIRLSPNVALAFYNRGVANAHKGISTALSRTTTKPSGSMQTMPGPITGAVRRTRINVTSIVPFRTTTRRSGLIPTTP